MSPTPRIYTSHVPDVQVHNTSIFTYLFGSRAGPDDVGGHSGSKNAFIDAATGTTITRSQLKHICLSFAHGIRIHPTTRPFANRGDTILIFSPNSLAWPVVMHGAIAAGLRCTFANSAYTSHELAFQYQNSGANLVLTSEEGITVVRDMFTECGMSKAEGIKRIVVLPRDLRWAGGPAAAPAADTARLLSLPDLLSLGTMEKEETFDGTADKETAILCYSSGTTGNPKGVESTHQNMTTVSELNKTVTAPIAPGRPMLAIVPFYHIFGAANTLIGIFSYGCCIVIQARFDPIEFCANIEKYRVGHVFVVPPVLVVLARHPVVDKYDLSSLEYMLSGGAPLGADLIEAVRKRLLSKRKLGAKCFIMQGYGLTETSPSTHAVDWDSSIIKAGSCGYLLPNVKARLVVDEDGEVDAEEGKPGELWVQGKTVMKGYLNNPEATKNSITSDGWFKTGDIAMRDNDGYWYIVDRKKELIKYKGFQVPPAELEAVLLTHPDIADVGVIGINSVEQATELPRAYVVHANPEKVKTAQAKAAFGQSVAKWIESRVARHKYLRAGVAVIDVVPKSAAGKILRKELRVRAKQEAARGEIDGAYQPKAKL
ncbi:AMP binding protein [Mycena pura]|uniref:AMP binding protein n=1 Tax=Mycena pura TaxID=153505 RepID=A0AAD6UPX6_9AGAR|nr:AMP binding protein [Mycena pura]